MKKFLCKGVYTFILLFIMLAMSHRWDVKTCYAATLGSELLINGGGDSGGGWIPVPDANQYTWTSYGGGHTNNFWGIYALGYFYNEEQCYQVIDVSNLNFNGGDIVANLSGYYWMESSYSSNYLNYLNIKLEQLDSNDNVLSTSTKDATVNNTWTQFLTSVTVLPGTKKLKVTLSGKIWGEGGGSLYVGVDDVSLTLNQLENRAPVISAIGDQVMDSGTTLGPINFTAYDPEGQSITYSVTSSDSSLISPTGISVNISGSSGQINLTANSNVAGTTQITVNVSDGVRNTTLKFNVTVYPNIQIGSNMVRNGDGSSTDGWVDPECRILTGSVFQVATANGTYFIYQDIDITKFSSYIDTGLASFTSACTTGSGATYKVEGIDGTGGLLWTKKSGNITAGTRTIRITAGGPIGATFDNVNVTIDNATRMSAITNQTVSAGTSIVNIPFSMIYPNTTPGTLSVSNSNPSIVQNGINILGSGYQGTISLNTVAGSHGTSTINTYINGNSTGSFTVTTYSAPSAPSITGVTDSSDGITVSFNAPASDGGSSIFNYVVTSNPGGKTASGSGGPLTVTGLTAGIQYTFTVKAENQGGLGTASGASSSIIWTTVPVVADPVISSILAHSASVGSNITSDGYSAVTARGIMYKKTTDITYTTVTSGSGSGIFNIPLTSLPMNTQYDVKTYATNAKGTTYSNVIQFTTLNNTPPTISAIAGPVTIDEDTTTSDISFTVGDNESTPDSLIVTAISDNVSLVPNNPANLVLGGSGASRTIKVVPSANQNGTVTITVTVADNYAETAQQTFHVTVNPVNDAPVANAASFNATEDTQMNGSLSGSDIERDSLTYELVGSPSKGSVTVNSNGTFTYTPDADKNGSDSFTFHVNDGALYSAAATVTINIAAVNDAPIANAATLNVTEDTPKNGSLSGSDVDGDSLTYELVGSPSKGSVTVNANGTFTYTPGLNKNGSDSFTFRVKDAALYSAAATITINIAAVNDAPTADAASFNATEDTPKDGSLSGSDIEGDSLTYVLVDAPSKGSVTVHTDGTFTYTPDADKNGSDSFTFRVNDGALYSAAATVTLNIAAVNDAPIANAATLNVTEDTPKNGSLSGSDVDGDSLTYELVGSPSKGSVTVNTDGTFTYTPGLNKNGSDSFTFRVKDAALYSAPATITIHIAAVNDAPTADAAILNATEDTPKSGSLSGSDIEGDSLTYELVGSPSKGSVIINADGTFTYTPNVNENGSDSFTFRVNDGALYSTSATVTLNIAAVNDAPIANAATLNVTEDTPQNGTLNGSDVDGDSLTYELVTAPSKGSVTVNSNGTFTYTPDADKNGNDSFTFRTKDAALYSTAATVSISIAAVNDAPEAHAVTLNVTEDTPKSGTLSGSDVDGDSLTYELVTSPSKGSVTVNADGTFTYTSDANVNGSDSFTFRVKDAALYSTAATITINIAAVNDAPVANAATLSVTEDTQKNGTLSGSDIDGDSLTYELVTSPSKGSVIINTDGTFTYTPGADKNGNDSFTFRVKDAALYSTAATVSISIAAVNDAPEAHATTLYVTEDTPKSGTLNGSDVDGDTLTYELISSPSKGSVTVNTNGTFTYTPAADKNGSDSFTFRVKDAALYSSAATVTINIAPVIDIPSAGPCALQVTEDTPSNGNLSGYSEDGASLTFILVSQPTKGIVVLDSNGGYTYKPNANVTGSDSFTYKVYDGINYSNIATVSINISEVNDIPVAMAYNTSTSKNTALQGTLSGSDIEGSSLTYLLVSGPAHGTVNISTDGRYTYQPNKDYIGNDSFSFKVNDGAADSSSAIVSITVTNIEVVLEQAEDTLVDGNYVIPSQAIEDELAAASKNNVVVTVKEPVSTENNNNQGQDTGLILKAEVLETAKDEGKSLQVTVKDDQQRELYTWSFNKEELTNSASAITDINLTIGVSSLTDNTLPGNTAVDNNSSGLLLSFAHEGELPGQTQIRIYVGDQAGAVPGSTIYLYHINHDTGMLESLPNSSGYTVDADGYVTIQIVHCSDYVLLFNEAQSSELVGLTDQITVTPAKSTLYYGGTEGSSIGILINLPSTLKIGQEKSDNAAIGYVTVQYASSNNNVATVDINGVITANGLGNAVIATTVILSDGTTKTFKTAIKVKKPYISFTKSTAIMKVGESFTFDIKAYGVDINNVVWSTTEKSIVTIDKKTGKAIAKTKGTDYVVAKIGSVKVKIKVVVS